MRALNSELVNSKTSYRRYYMLIFSSQLLAEQEERRNQTGLSVGHTDTHIDYVENAFYSQQAVVERLGCYIDCCWSVESKAVRMAMEAIDTNCMTLTRFILAEQKKYAPAGTGQIMTIYKQTLN